MSSIRFFGGAREIGKDSIAKQIMRIEKEKGCPLSAQERFKFIMDKKLKASKKEVTQKNGRQMSKSAAGALKQIAEKKAAKEAKILRQSVVVQKKIFNNGSVSRNGKIYDVAGNQIAKINKKNGKMVANNGAAIGQYKYNNNRVNAVIMDAINKHSPHFINLRKMQAMQAAGIDPRTGRPFNEEVINVHGNGNAAMHGGNYQSTASAMFMAQHGGAGSSNHFAEARDMHFDGLDGPKNVTATTWGAMSNNVWGTMGDNVWGTSGDNVWGSNNTDIWGTIGFKAMGKGMNVFGTGNGTNHLKPLINMVRKLLARPHKKTLAAFKQARQGGSAPARGPSAPARGPAGGGRR